MLAPVAQDFSLPGNETGFYILSSGSNPRVFLESFCTNQETGSAKLFPFSLFFYTRKASCSSRWWCCFVQTHHKLLAFQADDGWVNFLLSHLLTYGINTPSTCKYTCTHSHARTHKRTHTHTHIYIYKYIYYLYIFLNWGIMYIIYIFLTIVLIFVAMFITTFRPLYAPVLLQVVEMSNLALISLTGIDCSSSTSHV